MIYDDIMRELDSRQSYKASVYAPYYICSYAVHVFNLMNRQREVYWESKRLPNMRMHVVFVAPPGFMKSYYLGVMGGDAYGIFKNCGTNVGYEQSMCLPAGQYVQMADGSNKLIENVVPGDEVLSWDNKIVPTIVTHTLKLHSSKILKVTLEDGRVIRLTPEHPLLTFPIKWKQVGEVKCSEYIAVPRKYDIQGIYVNPSEAYLIGLMLADGNFRGLTVYGDNEEIYEECKRCVESLGCNIRKNPKRPIEWIITDSGSGYPNRVRQLLNTYGLTPDVVKETKFIPREVFTWDNRAIGMLLRGLISGDGHVGSGQIQFTNLSRSLIYGAQQLLLRFGIISTIWYNKDSEIYNLYIRGADVDKYLSLIGVSYPSVDMPKTRKASKGKVPPGIWEIIDQERGEVSWNKLGMITGFALAQSKSKHTGLPNDVVLKIGEYLQSDILCKIADPTIAWMKIQHIVELPEDDVYNLSTDNHTFVAQNIITHNSEAGFIGTVVNMNGVGFPEYGAAYQFKEGVLLVDEFSAITDAMHVQYNTQLSTQLLAALDHGNVHKRLANGKIAYETSLTLWAGVQPARYDLSSGLGRRLFFLLFLPTRDDNEQLMRTMHATRNLRPNRPAMEGLWHKIDHFRQSMDGIQKVEFDNDVLDIYFKLGLYSYESAYFDRLMLGYQLAMYGPEKHVVVNTKDQELLELVTREKLWRDEIAKGVDYTQIIRIIEELGGKVTKAMLVEEAIMVGWNAEQVYSTLADMSKYGVVRFQGPYVELIR